jgi:hypothetical protein
MPSLAQAIVWIIVGLLGGSLAALMITRERKGFGILRNLGIGLVGGPDIPTITLNESEEGAAGLRPLEVPRPNRWDQQSIWNMKVVGLALEPARLYLGSEQPGGAGVHPSMGTAGSAAHCQRRYGTKLLQRSRAQLLRRRYQPSYWHS